MSAPTSSRSSAVISRGTLVGGGILVGLVALFAFLSTQMYADVLTEAQYAAAYWFGTSLQGLFALVIVAVAVRIGLRQGVGRQWLLIGAGVAAYAIGDIIWTVYEVHLGIDPYPSVADIFYTLEYPLFLAAVALAIASYREIVRLRAPVIAGVVVSLVAASFLYFRLLGPYIFAAGVEELGFWGFVVSTLYPLGDVFFMIGPALTLALVIRTLGAGRLGWPWWIVVTGALVFAAADSVYAYNDWAGIGSNTLLDLGWITANLLFAIAALVARDVYRVR